MSNKLAIVRMIPRRRRGLSGWREVLYRMEYLTRKRRRGGVEERISNAC